MKHARIYVDTDGSSHFEDMDVELEQVDRTPPVPPLDLSSFVQTSQFAFCRFPAGWFADWHRAPRRQFFFFFSGEIEIGVSEGDVRRFGPGSVVLLEDTDGKGHTTRVIGKEDVLSAVVQLA